MSQLRLPQKLRDAGSMPTLLMPGSHITTLNVLTGFVVLLIVMFLVMSLTGIGPFSWGN